MNIIISLTTVPNRLMEPHDHMGARLGLKTILDQSYKNFTIHFNIPYRYKLTNEEITIPNWLNDYSKKYSNLEIYRTEDHGPITKILPTIERINDPETIIIVADDDLYYMNGLIEAHLKARDKYPNHAIGFAGMSAIDGSCHFCTSVKEDKRVKILEGYKTVSYKRNFFDQSLYNFLDKSWNDDLILSAYMGYKNIPKIVIAYEQETDFSPRVESFPVIGHTPIERGGCFNFRNSTEYQQISELNANLWYKNGYLER
jgi:hypothetical protein